MRRGLGAIRYRQFGEKPAEVKMNRKRQKAIWATALMISIAPVRNPSGVVLGKGRDGKPKFLTSREIRQMPAMPELVFLNCCYLGKTDNPAVSLAPKQWLQSVDTLAASLAEELIKKGVRAVIAAGWAVHDVRAAEQLSNLEAEPLALRVDDVLRNQGKPRKKFYLKPYLNEMVVPSFSRIS